MADIVDQATRSRMMSGIRGKNTRPEIIIRKALHKMGYRYRLHDRKLPGKPDLVFSGKKAVIFIHGCFWHKHDCHLFRWPSTRREFWQKKILGNCNRDEKTRACLSALDWRILTIWECSVKGKTRLPVDALLERTVSWLENTDVGNNEITGE
ncbi:very short patch repair endonuclease [Kordiimonas sp.]|uniref:very short patch repair endonuclease n=1 Tax=Kordiimonas sp. TaxID=1970157 RepID=UPI003A95C7B0